MVPQEYTARKPARTHNGIPIHVYFRQPCLTGALFPEINRLRA